MTCQADDRRDANTLTECGNHLVRTSGSDVSNKWLVSGPSGHRTDCDVEVVREPIWDICVCWVAVDVDDMGQDGWRREFHEGGKIKTRARYVAGPWERGFRSVVTSRYHSNLFLSRYTRNSGMKNTQFDIFVETSPRCPTKDVVLALKAPRYSYKTYRYPLQLSPFSLFASSTVANLPLSFANLSTVSGSPTSRK